MPTVAPYGSWASPISAGRIAAGSVKLSGPRFAPDGGVVWLEGRPSEGGRSVLVRRAPEGGTEDLIPAGFNVRTRVHEYGGGAWLFAGEAIVFSNFEDQRLYRIDPGESPRPITPEPAGRASIRYADGRATPDGSSIVCVRETHGEAGVVNEVVSLPSDGEGEAVVIAGGNDFYAAPRISPDGARLAWIEWAHPQMPWDGSELWSAELADGEVTSPQQLAGPEESIWQPDWSPDGTLHYASDRSGWWNLYREPDHPIAPEAAEFGYPHWIFGGSTYGFDTGGGIVCIRIERAEERLCAIPPGSGAAEPFELPFTSYGFPSLDLRDGRALFVAGAPDRPRSVIELELESGRFEVLRRSTEAEVESGCVSIPRAIEFPTTGERTAHGFYYPPANADFEGPAGERPPLIVQIHGGPSAHDAPELSLDVLFWTSRGFGIVDVNYGGSTGYGRAYRERLRGTWGIVDRDDCTAAARYLAESGDVDGERLAIHGGSAGGYTTLCALVFGDEFAAGASYYGVADAETLATDTHKFESRYLDGLIGPYPEAAERYRERSPIHFVERLRSPVVIFQGLEDEVVPPSQAEQIVAALAENGIPHAYLGFAGEQHGFRQAETIVRCHEAELSFYGQIFGFGPAGPIEPLAIENLA